jgi:hypothetical protein
MTCDNCGQKFGGSVAFERHLDQETDTCVPADRLPERGLKRPGSTWYVATVPRETRAITHAQLVTR